VLTGEYRQEASDVRLALERGDYNCLSALVIYWQLSREANLDLQIWSRPGHVYLVNAANGERIEPASPNWFQQGAETADVPMDAASRQITSTQLLGKFYYNRGVIALRQGQYAEGLRLVRTSLALDPHDREAHANLLAGLNNWAAALYRQSRYAEARELIEQGLAIEPRFAPLVANERLVGHQARP
jgi:tetratricopeptide (TPR) repeat protein